MNKISDELFSRRIPASVFENMAGYGSWIYYKESGRLFLSSVAADFMGVPPAILHDLNQGLLNVLAEDSTQLSHFIQNQQTLGEAEIDFRVLRPNAGLRWFRMSQLPPSNDPPNCIFGTLIDVTDRQHALIREHLAFELTECLIGSNHFEKSITQAIQLICQNLDWEWGAYWSVDQTNQQKLLKCKHQWSKKGCRLDPFEKDSMNLCLRVGQGLVGQVWQSGQAQWVEDIETSTDFLRQNSARACGLLSGFIFPVTYTTPTGEAHCPGVLEFYSYHSRQPDAQLPKLSASIGALIAQTSQKLEREAVIDRLAHYDELTGLINRNKFQARLSDYCKEFSRRPQGFDVILIDLDRLKPINDTFGDEVGDGVLREFATRLLARVSSRCTLARIGSHEFGLIMEDHSPQDVAALMNEVLRMARQPFMHEELRIVLSAEVAWRRFPFHGSTADHLMRSAYAAMQAAKRSGRHAVDVFSEHPFNDLDEAKHSLARRLDLEAELNHAIERGELQLVYQPIFDIGTGRIHAIEALSRWHSAKYGAVPPDVFIPIAEQSHLIVEIGLWVMNQSCEDLATLYRHGFCELKVHINLAASEFTNAELPGRLEKLVRQHQLPPSSVVLELTEGMLMRSPEKVIPIMKKLRASGFEISLDDFGMGHSSLSLLKNLPISSMKVDRSFVRHIETDASDHAIARMIIALGEQLNLEVIIEGVETAAQLDWLQSENCALIQGYWLSKPLSLQQLRSQYPGPRVPMGHRAAPNTTPAGSAPA